MFQQSLSNKVVSMKMNPNKYVGMPMVRSLSSVQVFKANEENEKENKKEKGIVPAPKLCVQCKHFVHKKDGKHGCKQFQQFDLVNGYTPTYAHDNRFNEIKCGKAGQYYVYNKDLDYVHKKIVEVTISNKELLGEFITGALIGAGVSSIAINIGFMLGLLL